MPAGNWAPRHELRLDGDENYRHNHDNDDHDNDMDDMGI